MYFTRMVPRGSVIIPHVDLLAYIVLVAHDKTEKNSLHIGPNVTFVGPYIFAVGQKSISIGAPLQNSAPASVRDF